MERLLDTDGSTVWVGIREQYATAEVTVTVCDQPPGPVKAWHVTCAGLDVAGDLLVHDGYPDATVRGTVPIDPGRWTIRVALLDEPDPLGMADDDTVVRVRVDLWRPVEGAPDVAEVRLVHAGAPQPSSEEDTGAGTRQRRGALAWDSRLPMKLVIVPGDTQRRTGYLTLHLDDDGALWGFWYDQGTPMLTEIERPIAERLLATGQIRAPLTGP